MQYNVCDWKNVEDMYKYASEQSLPLLSNFNAAFWGEYVLNYQRYDKLFYDMYKSFRYFNQVPFTQDNTIDMVTINFIDDVYNHLMINKKRYEELFKIEIMNSPSITNDFYTEELLKGSKNINSDYTSGSRKDTNIETTGSRHDEEEHKKMAFNSTNYVNDSKDISDIGSQTDNSTFNKGIQNDTEKRGEQNNQSIITKGYHNNPYDNLKKYIGTWDSWSLYSKIFKELASDLLLV